MPFGIGVVGAGVIGQLRAAAVRANPATRLIGVVDPVPAAAQRAAAGSGARVLAEQRQLLELPDLDAVIVSSPVHHHEEGSLAALAAGKHVLCEKPLSNSAESCRRIYQAARTAGCVLATGFNHRYYPAIKFVKQALSGGSARTTFVVGALLFPLFPIPQFVVELLPRN